MNKNRTEPAPTNFPDAADHRPPVSQDDYSDDLRAPSRRPPYSQFQPDQSSRPIGRTPHYFRGRRLARSHPDPVPDPEPDQPRPETDSDHHLLPTDDDRFSFWEVNNAITAQERRNLQTWFRTLSPAQRHTLVSALEHNSLPWRTSAQRTEYHPGHYESILARGIQFSRRHTYGYQEDIDENQDPSKEAANTTESLDSPIGSTTRTNRRRPDLNTNQETVHDPEHSIQPEDTTATLTDLLNDKFDSMPVRPQQSGAVPSARGKGKRKPRRKRTQRPKRGQRKVVRVVSERHRPHLSHAGKAFLLCHTDPFHHGSAAIRPRVAGMGSLPFENAIEFSVKILAEDNVQYFLFVPSPVVAVYYTDNVATTALDAGLWKNVKLWDGTGSTANPTAAPAGFMNWGSFAVNALSIQVEPLGAASTQYADVTCALVPVPSNTESTLLLDQTKAFSTLGISDGQFSNIAMKMGGGRILTVPGNPVQATAKFVDFEDQMIVNSLSTTQSSNITANCPVDPRLTCILIRLMGPTNSVHRITMRSCFDATPSLKIMAVNAPWTGSLEPLNEQPSEFLAPFIERVEKARKGFAYASDYVRMFDNLKRALGRFVTAPNDLEAPLAAINI